MGIKAINTMSGKKSAPTITTFVSGSPVAVGNSEIGIYTDIPAANQHRYLEICNQIERLLDWARERKYEFPTVTTRYYYSTIDAAKSNISTGTAVASINSGKVAIGIGTTLLSSRRWSMEMTNRFTEMLDYLRENRRLVV